MNNIKPQWVMPIALWGGMGSQQRVTSIWQKYGCDYSLKINVQYLKKSSVCTFVSFFICVVAFVARSFSAHQSGWVANNIAFQIFCFFEKNKIEPFMGLCGIDALLAMEIIFEDEKG